MNGNDEHSDVRCDDRNNSLYRLSIFFGLLPQVIGVCIFILWYFTRADGFVSAGFFTMIAGLISVLIAGFSLVIYLYAERQQNISARRLFKKGLISGGVMMANFPLAYIFASIAIHIMAMYSLTLVNGSSSPVSKIVITAPGISKVLEHVEPNERIVQEFYFDHEGAMSFSVFQNEVETSGVLEGYVDGNTGGDTILIVKDNGKYEIIKREMD